MIITAMQDRVRRGQWLHAHGYVHQNGSPGEFDVDSQYTAGKTYQVQIDTDENLVLQASCDCPDWAKMDVAIEECLDHGQGLFHPGISQINGSPLCKHEVACLLEMGIMEVAE